MIDSKNLLEQLRVYLQNESSLIQHSNIQITFQIPKETVYPHIVLEAQQETAAFSKTFFVVTVSIFSLDASGQEAEELMESIGMTLHRMRRFTIENQNFVIAFEKKAQKRTSRSPYTLVRQHTCFITTTVRRAS